MMRKLLISIVLLLTGNVLAFADRLSDARFHHHVVDSLTQCLIEARTAQDSIKILYDLYDVAFFRDRMPYVETMYRTAVRCGDVNTRLDALRILANLGFRNDSLQDVQQRRAALIVASPEQKETLVFIKIMRAATAARNLSGEELRNKLHMVLQGYRSDQQVDLYRRIELLFTICKYLEGRNTSDMLFDYLADLEELINKLPDVPGALRSAFYTSAAISNTDAGRHAQALEADRKLIEVMTAFERRYHKDGRKFCRYTANYYIVYRRMLSNYEALTDAQVDELYANVQQLAKMNPDIAEDIEVSGRLVDAYYLMSKGKYSQALPLLMKAYPMQVNSARSKWLLQMAITAATHCGNDAALLKAYKAYLPLVEHQFNSSEEDRLLEYQVLYDVNSLNAYNADLEAQYARAEAQQRKTGMYVAIAAIVLLVVILGLLYYAYRRTKRLTENLADANKLLIGERDNLRRIQKELILARDQSRQAERHKTDFINSISHELTEPVEAILGYSQLIVDSVEGTRRDVLDKFVQIIELNAQMLRTIVNDVLDVAELENSRVVVKFKNTTLKEICEFSVETVRQRVKPGVELVVDELGWNECGACCIDTDPLRAEQVIINLLINSAKFTEKGRIAVLYGMDNVSNRAQIIVEDTGPGIPKGMERRIFERFYKGSPVNQGVGLGLTICRLVSQLLGGEVTLDNTYTTGSRFIFTLPINKVDKAAHIVPVV